MINEEQGLVNEEPGLVIEIKIKRGRFCHIIFAREFLEDRLDRKSFVFAGISSEKNNIFKEAIAELQSQLLQPSGIHEQF